MNVRLELVDSGQHMKIPRSLTYHMSSLSIKVIENSSMSTSSTESIKLRATHIKFKKLVINFLEQRKILTLSEFVQVAY